ncbi:nicotinic acid mononucleotide adenyltransferase [uncultured Kordia sp.]|uniref:toxin-antitoxin system YwqK family antitoxin n=1 Tax=uncultured Kordia sp. TaxID=507699 RepID=UPI00260E576E|nr:nicotinic acid mononucleotide adenyltransferase [uncultured Kordia sp.]
MKKLLLIAVFLVSGVAAFAQNSDKPTLEKKGDLVKATYYHDNGVVAQTGYFTLNGKLQGEWKSFDAKGNKTAVGNYDKGQKVGKWFFWNTNQLSEVDYNASKIKDVNTWKRSTSVVSNK